jgi:hypothetical protein
MYRCNGDGPVSGTPKRSLAAIRAETASIWGGGGYYESSVVSDATVASRAVCVEKTGELAEEV